MFGGRMKQCSWVGDKKISQKESKIYSHIFNASKKLLNSNSKAVSDITRALYGGDSAPSKISEVSPHFFNAESTISDNTSFYTDLLKESSCLRHIFSQIAESN